MRKGVRPSFMIVVLLVVLSACGTPKEEQQAQEARNADCKAWLTVLKQPSEASNAFWNLRTVRVFGPNCNCGTVVGPIEEGGTTYKAEFTCWLSGTDLEGNRLQVRRTVVALGESRPGIGSWQFQSAECHDKRLSWWYQVGTWLLYAILGPIVILLAWFWVAYLISLCSGNLAEIAIVVTAIVWAGISAWRCFGTAWAVIIGILVYIPILGMIYQRLSK